jgi:hypothetical protein
VKGQDPVATMVGMKPRATMVVIKIERCIVEVRGVEEGMKWFSRDET